jgi:membrane-associated phospholipid phosphatase
VVAVIRISRILLEVRYVSDVVGGWCLGIAWLGLTAYAFQLSRHTAGRPVTQPLVEGLEPEAQHDLKPSDTPPSRRPLEVSGRQPMRSLDGAAVVGRSRPEVTHLDSSPPTFSYPSGHVAAVLCLYTAVVLLVMPRTQRWWRRLVPTLAV